MRTSSLPSSVEDGEPHTFWHKLEQLTRSELPALNQRIEEGRANLDDLIRSGLQVVAAFSNHFDSRLETFSEAEALKAIQLLGFWVGSAERHAQTADHKRGDAVRSLEVEDLFVKLGRLADHVPRDGHITYWLRNGDNPITFTGDPQEIVFNERVNLTETLHTRSCDALRPICEGNIAVVSAQALEALKHVEANMLKLWQEYTAFMKTCPQRGEWNMTPLFFMLRMRTYLPAYPIRGRMLHGPNATNVIGQARIDFLTGLVNAWYADEVVPKRFEYLRSEERYFLSKDMSLPSVLNRLLETLGLTEKDLLKLDASTIRRRVAHEPQEYRQALAAYGRVVKAAGKLAAIHWALIQNYLVKPSKKMTSEQLCPLAVKADHGVGGNPLEHTKRIMDMRRKHPVASKLLAGLEPPRRDRRPRCPIAN